MPAPKTRLHSDQPDPADRPATDPAPGPTPGPSPTPEADSAAPPPSDGTARPDGSRRRTFAPSRLSLFLVAVLAGSALFVGGFSLGAHVATTPGTPADEETHFGPFWDVYSLIQNDYAGSPKPTEDQLVQAAIKGMMESLNDPWSYYQGPSDFQSSLLSVGRPGRRASASRSSSSRSIPARASAAQRPSATAASWPSSSRSPDRPPRRPGSRPAT